MAEIDQESKRAEEWLTQGRPRTIRTRGAVRTRGTSVAAPPVSGLAVQRIAAVTELLAQLQAEVPELPWVVVLNGRLDTVAEQVFLHVKDARAAAKFWLIGSEQEVPISSALAPLNPLRLHPQHADEARFINNLVADLVIVTPEPHASQEERLRRWLPQTRYVLATELGASLLEKLQSSVRASGSQARLCILTSEA
jgi:hypothetical protein